MDDIFGYTFDEISLAQQGGRLGRVIDTSKPTLDESATEEDEFLFYYRFIDPRDRSIDLTKDIMVECSECGYEFDVYFEGDNQTDINSRIHQYIEELKTSEKHRIRDRCRFRRRNDETVLTRDDD